jgi:hypothetical protein
MATVRRWRLQSAAPAQKHAPIGQFSAPTAIAPPNVRANTSGYVPQFTSSGRRRKQIPYRNDRAGGLVQQGLSVAEALLVNIGLISRQINAIR